MNSFKKSSIFIVLMTSTLALSEGTHNGSTAGGSSRAEAEAPTTISNTNKLILMQIIQARKDELGRQEQDIISIEKSLRTAKVLAGGTIVVSIPVALAGGSMVIGGGKVLINTIKESGIKNIFFETNILTTPVAIAALAVGSAMLTGDYVVIKLTQDNKAVWAKKLETARKRIEEIKQDIARAERELKGLNGK